MTRLTDAELRIALDRQDWNTLWLAAELWVKFVMASLQCGDEDALQEGRLAAGLAIRSWNPARGAFSTHVASQVRGALLNWCNSHATAGVGSRRQAADDIPISVISLHDPALSPGNFDLTDDAEARPTHQDNLTYDDIDDFNSINALIQTLDVRGQLLTALDRLPSDESKFLREVMRHGGVTAFAKAVGLAHSTVSEKVFRIVQKLSDGLRKTWYIDTTGVPVSETGRSRPSVVRNRRFLPGGDDFGSYRWQRAMLGPSVRVESSLYSGGCPMADWSWKPTPEDVKRGAEPRRMGYPWSAGAKKLMGLPRNKRGR
jgi:DNA-directed RNA polymerase specialized sigma24 family protein